MGKQFRKFASAVSKAVGSAWAFIAALALIVGWAASGPIFGFTDTWQLVINTGTTIVTFLMVFLIQNTQNRDQDATNKKLDALIAANDRISNQLIGMEDPDKEG